MRLAEHYWMAWRVGGKQLNSTLSLCCSTSEQQETMLTVINVYCPRADPEKPERGDFKLQFYRLLQARAEALLRAGG